MEVAIAMIGICKADREPLLARNEALATEEEGMIGLR